MVGRLARTVGAAACAACAASAGAPGATLMKGVSYGPTPVTSPGEASRLPEDDYFCDEAAPMWSSAGRGDLKVISSLGANLVRLYGNDPRNNHGKFLDEAHAQGLQVAVGMSDWPYYQQVPGSCKDATDFNCFTQVRPLYLDNLKKGFVRSDGTYHPAVRVVNILNEPDLKMPPTATTGGEEGPQQMARALISAFDAMLDAEREMDVKGPLVNFTATFSYAICAACEQFKANPALGQMAQLDDAMRHPEKYGYSPKNDITAAYHARWMHSFNTQNPATDLQRQFLDDYAQTFPATPVYIGEYHRVNANQTEDLSMILSIAEQSALFVGISFFEFTVSYYKTGSEMDFGMFGYGDKKVASMDYFGRLFSVPCLAPEPNPEAGAGMTMAEAVARVYGGRVDDALLCNRSSATSSSTTAGATLPMATTTGSSFLASTATATATASTTTTTTTTGAAAARTTAAHDARVGTTTTAPSSAAARRSPLALLRGACAAALLSATSLGMVSSAQ